MKATRHNGRSGKHGTYDAKHNDRRFDVENREHIDAERTKFNVYYRVKTIDGILTNTKTCPEETLLQLGNIDGIVSADVLAQISAEYFEEFNKRYGSHVHILDWALHLDEATPHIHERHVFSDDTVKGIHF